PLRRPPTAPPCPTYSRAGLPPTPIAMAGAAAIRAATRPGEGDELYFVAVGDDSGRHVFSRTYAEHQRAVREYGRRYRERFGPGGDGRGARRPPIRPRAAWQEARA